jgi:hypothetical protein
MDSGQPKMPTLEVVMPCVVGMVHGPDGMAMASISRMARTILKFLHATIIE